jgi:N-acyl-D-amino-acid deacylase
MVAYDIVIKNGTIVDGTRFPRYRADIGVKDGRIAKIGRIDASAGRKVIDAAGKIVAPGHIDLHTHYDAQMHWDPYCTNSGNNGVTTVVAGNCGFGFAPCRPSDRDRYMLMMENTEQVPYAQMKATLPWTWETFPQWLDHVRGLKKGVNMMMFMPLNPLMCYVMGVEAAKSRPATKAEMAEMKRQVHEAMDAGACGIGVSHLGNQNSHTDYDGSAMPTDTMSVDDATELASVLAERDEGFVQVLSQLGAVMDSDFCERIARAAKRPVIQNIFVTIEAMPEYHKPQVAWLDRVNDEGLPIWGQSFSQPGWSEFNMIELNINDHVPEWREMSMIKDHGAKIEKFKDEAFRARMRASYNPEILMFGSGPLEVIKVSSVGKANELEPLVDKMLAEIAAAQGKHVIDVLLDIAIASDGWADFRTPPPVATDRKLAASLLSHPRILAGTSDGGAHSRFFCGGHWPTELIIRFTRDEPLMSLEDIHYRLSYQPARVVGLSDRGALIEGAAADIIVYDYDRLALGGDRYEVRWDMPNKDWRRYMPTSGYEAILVNGEVTWSGDACTNATPGDFVSVTSARPGGMRQAAE